MQEQHRKKINTDQTYVAVVVTYQHIWVEMNGHTTVGTNTIYSILTIEKETIIDERDYIEAASILYGDEDASPVP